MCVNDRRTRSQHPFHSCSAMGILTRRVSSNARFSSGWLWTWGHRTQIPTDSCRRTRLTDLQLLHSVCKANHKTHSCCNFGLLKISHHLGYVTVFLNLLRKSPWAFLAIQESIVPITQCRTISDGPFFLLPVQNQKTSYLHSAELCKIGLYLSIQNQKTSYFKLLT